MRLEYSRVEEQAPAALPEIRQAAERYWQAEGKPGDDCGAYIFFEGMFATYVKVLLAMESSPGRDQLLQRVFQFVEDMLASDDLDVRNLAMLAYWNGRPNGGTPELLRSWAPAPGLVSISTFKSGASTSPLEYLLPPNRKVASSICTVYVW